MEVSDSKVCSFWAITSVFALLILNVLGALVDPVPKSLTVVTFVISCRFLAFLAIGLSCDKQSCLALFLAELMVVFGLESSGYILRGECFYSK